MGESQTPDYESFTPEQLFKLEQDAAEAIADALADGQTPSQEMLKDYVDIIEAADGQEPAGNA